MGRKRRKGRGKARKRRRRAVGTEKRTIRLSSSIVKFVFLVAAIVAIVTLAAVILSVQEPLPDDDGGNNIPPPTPNRVPVPKAMVTPAEAFIGENVTFDASRSYDPDPTDRIVNFTWEVHRDWITGPIIHTYYKRKFNRSFDEPGTMYIVLKVTDDRGGKNSSISANQYGGAALIINSREPIAVAGDNVTTVVGREVYLDAKDSYDEDGQIIKYHWDFGDGEGEDGAFVDHVYMTAGNYTVTLTVTDNHNVKGSDTLWVVVR